MRKNHFSKKNILFYFSVLLIITGITVICLQPLFFSFLTHLTEDRLHNHINIRIKIKLARLIYTQGIFIILSGIIMILLRNNTGKIKSLIADEPVFYTGSNKKISFNLFLYSSISGIIITIIYQFSGTLFFGLPGLNNSILKYLYGEDYFFETMTAVFLIISVFLLIKSVICLRKKNKYTGKIIIFYLILSMSFLFIALEEINWGQRIFKWPTPHYFTEVNLQNETNIHNMIDCKSTVFYKVFSIILLLISIYSLFKFDENKELLLHPSIIILVYLIVFSSFCEQSELTEELVSLFAFFYSYRCFKLSSEER